MASPPFNINQALPGDTDIVSQHPGNARTMRDVVESWLLVNHDTNGNHARVDIPRTASPTTPAASIDVLYTTTTGRLKIKHPDGTEEYVGLPPGSEIYVSGALPTGYLEKDGSLISRAVFPDLFTYLGTTFSAGDGSTTFGLPDDKGRGLVGIDAAGVRLTSTYLGTAAILNAVGGVDGLNLTAVQIPTHTSVNASQAISVTSTSALYLRGVSSVLATAQGGGGGGVGFDQIPTVAAIASTGTNSISTTYTNASQTGASRVQPTRVARAVIKY